MKVLDVGCGSAGGVSIAFCKDRNAEVYGIDIDRNRVKMAKAKVQGEKLMIHFLVADGLALPFRFGTFDIAVCNDVIEHVPKPRQLAVEVHGSLRNGGLLYLSAPNGISPYRIIRDAHYDLLFLSLMPYRIGKYYSTKIMNITEKYDVYGPFTYWEIKKVLLPLFGDITECYKNYYLSNCGRLLQLMISRFPDKVLRLVVPTLVLCGKK